MNTWSLLKKELLFYGIKLTDDGKCQIKNPDGKWCVFNIDKSREVLKDEIEKEKNIMRELWDDLISLLVLKINRKCIMDENIKKMFIFSLKDLIKFINCFPELDNSEYKKIIDMSIGRNINSFSYKQISKTIDYKIGIDWTHRCITRLLYVSKLLYWASLGKKKINEYKVARGIQGPWAHMDLPMLERRWPFDEESLTDRMKDKQRQRRYTKGLRHYNTPEVGEGHYWRELRNEPYSWYKKDTESPYPSRSTLTNY